MRFLMLLKFMAKAKLLPKEFVDEEGKRLEVGQWIRWNAGPPIKNPTLIWQLTESQPGHYQAVSHAHKLTLPITATNSRDFMPLYGPYGNLAPQIRLEDYPQLYKRFHERGIDAFFVNQDGRPEVYLKMHKRRNRISPILLPDVELVKNDVALLERWVDQQIWIAEHPKKYRILEWVTDEEYAKPFGEWPEVTSPKALDKLAKEWSPEYQDYLDDIELDDYLESLPPNTQKAQPVPGQLPTEYTSVNDYPLIVGDWVFTGLFNGVEVESPFTEDYFWRIQESTPGVYKVVGARTNKEVLISPANSWMLYPVAVQVSERLRFDRHSKYWELFQEQGIAGYFFENSRREMTLALVKFSGPDKGAKHTVVAKSFVQDMEQDPALLERWLDQMIWCIENPVIAAALYWAMQRGHRVFGRWPQLATPTELYHAAVQWYEPYLSDLQNVRSQLAYNQQADADEDRYEETKLLNDLQKGVLDKSITPHIKSLLDGTGVDTPE